MTQIAVIYHSAQGHTAHIARMIIEGISQVRGTEAQLLEAGALASAPDTMLPFDGSSPKPCCACTDAPTQEAR